MTDDTFDPIRAINSYEAERVRFFLARKEANDCAAALSLVKGKLAEIEDDILAGSMASYIDGKNAEVRQAQVHNIALQSPEYREAVQKRNDLEHEKGVAEAKIEDATQAMRATRLAIEYETARLLQEAAALGSGRVAGMAEALV